MEYFSRGEVLTHSFYQILQPNLREISLFFFADRKSHIFDFDSMYFTFNHKSLSACALFREILERVSAVMVVFFFMHFNDAVAVRNSRKQNTQNFRPNAETRRM